VPVPGGGSCLGRSRCIIRQWTLGPDSPLTARLKAGSYVTSVIRCLTNLSYAAKIYSSLASTDAFLLTDFIAVPEHWATPREHTGGMPVRLHHIVVDAHDLPGLARFWTQALGWKVLSERENEIVIGTDENAPVGMCFMPVTDPKTVKNRLHLDLTSSAADRDEEIDRLLALGARRVDIGQTGAESWTVLADPEGNEFCVVRPKDTLIG
jgi:predicted enzyme related to lactoylglutathione lyase